jgi:hypothetical protein
MKIEIDAVVEYNESGYLIHSQNHIGAFVRGRTKGDAIVGNRVLKGPAYSCLLPDLFEKK